LLSFRSSIIISTLFLELPAAFSSLCGLIGLSLVTSKGENWERQQLGFEFYYANVLRSIFQDLLNIAFKREKTVYNMSSKWLEILPERFRDSIPIIMTAKLMVSDQALSNWFQYPAHADNIRMRFVNVLEE
jgi:hypothetical protein